MIMIEKGYVASKDVSFMYPGAGDPKPPGGAQVLLLTIGGICVRGTWGSKAFIGWYPLPGRDKDKENRL